MTGLALFEGGARSVVLECKDRERKILCTGSFDRGHSVFESRSAIGHEPAEFIAGYDQNSDVNIALGDLVAKVHYIHDQQITSG